MTDGGEPWRLSATRLSARLAAGKIAPTDLLDHVLRRVDALNPAINAIVALCPDARAAAEESEVRLARGEARSPLEGIPLTVKDNIPVKGVAATWGSRVFADFVPDRDELAVARLRAAGAVVVGKTNAPEFTLDGYTGNLLFGTTRNPWDIRLTPGGSSGGAVASVAAGLTPLAIGTDGGGSIRRPASHTGLVGLKPSTGRVPRIDGFPQILLDFEVIGPIARTVADAAMLDAAMAGPDTRDRRSLLVEPPGPGPGVAVPPDPLRILYVARFGDAPLDREIEASVAAAARTLRDLGHQLTDGALPFDVEDMAAIWPVITKVGLAYLLDRHAGRRALAAPKYLDIAAEGAAMPATRYLDAIERIGAFRGQVADAFATVDVIMTPSAAALPWPADDAFPPEIDGHEVGPRGHAVYTGWVNACGHPAIDLPAAPSRSGLPIGFQLVGRFGADTLLLRLAAQFEAVSPWADRWPALATGGPAAV